jgi:hypothetical protein
MTILYCGDVLPPSVDTSKIPAGQVFRLVDGHTLWLMTDRSFIQNGMPYRRAVRLEDGHEGGFREGVSKAVPVKTTLTVSGVDAEAALAQWAA